MAAGSDAPLEKIVGLFSEQSGYATPKVDTRGVVFRDGALLMVKELEDGRWTLPGGWADILESLREAVEREVFEESGFRTRAVKLLAVFDRSKHPHEPPYPYHIYKLFMQMRHCWRGSFVKSRNRGCRILSRKCASSIIAFARYAKPNQTVV